MILPTSALSPQVSLVTVLVGSYNDLLVLVKRWRLIHVHVIWTLFLQQVWHRLKKGIKNWVVLFSQSSWPVCRLTQLKQTIYCLIASQECNHSHLLQLQKTFWNTARLLSTKRVSSKRLAGKRETAGDSDFNHYDVFLDLLLVPEQNSCQVLTLFLIPSYS